MTPDTKAAEKLVPRASNGPPGVGSFLVIRSQGVVRGEGPHGDCVRLVERVPYKKALQNTPPGRRSCRSSAGAEMVTPRPSVVPGLPFPPA